MSWILHAACIKGLNLGDGIVSASRMEYLIDIAIMASPSTWLRVYSSEDIAIVHTAMAQLTVIFMES